MNAFFESLIILSAIIVFARLIKRKSKLLQRFFIPSSLVAGVIGLLIGPQVFGFIPVEITGYWALLPKFLITVVFAGLFLGRAIPKLKDIWRVAGPHIAFGNMVAWGQYVVGLLLTIFILTPFFGANPMTAALIEISFEGGHGTAAGLAPAFQALGYPEGADIALALATFSIFAVIISGIVILNWRQKQESKIQTEEDWECRSRRNIRSGYNLITVGKKISNKPQALVTNALGYFLAIGLGWLMLRGLIELEELLLAGFTDLRFFGYVPLFPMAMIGGLILQLILRRLKLGEYINRRMAEIISAMALDFLIASAVATISLQTIGDNLAIFTLLALAGTGWILFTFFCVAPRMFCDHWFERGLTETGQSMGTTATGLMLMRQVDPSNQSKAKEGFAYKQLIFEPFMGGGIITATSIVIISQFGSWTFLLIAFFITIFWLILGLKLFGGKRR